MLSCPPLKAPANDDRTVDIALDTSNLKILVACMTKDSATITEQLSWQTVKRIVSVCDTFGLTLVAVRLLSSGFTIGETDGWDIFCVAAEHDQYLLARAAIPNLVHSKVIGARPHRCITSAMIDQCTKPFLAQLLLAIARASPDSISWVGSNGWKQVANDFRRP